MAIIYSYPQAIPKDSDLIIGTVTYDPNDPSPVRGNPTRSFRVSDLAASITGNSYTLTSKALGANSSIVLTDNTGFIAGTVNFNSGAGVSALNSGNTITITNTGVLSNIAGTGISLSGTTGNVTITNSGVTGVAITDTTFVDLSLSSATGDVTLTAALSATGTPTNLNFLRGDNTWAVPAGGGTVTSVNSGTGISVDNTDPDNPIINNSAPDQTVSISGSGGTSVSGTYPSFTISSGDLSGYVTGSGSPGSVPLWDSSGDTLTNAPIDVKSGNQLNLGALVNAGNLNGMTALIHELRMYNRLYVGSTGGSGSNGDVLISTGATTDAQDGLDWSPVADYLKRQTTDISTFNSVDDDVTLGGGSASNTLLASQLAIKTYVDNSAVGALVYQGGYDASTNDPVLDDRGTQIAVSKGWTYTVTVDGTFYGEVVKVGDVLIAETNLAAGTGALTDWTTVQSNIDLATAGTSGTAIRGLAGFNEDNFTVSNGFVSAKSTTSNSTITGTTTVTHTLDTRDVIVQLYDTVTFETIYADVVRTSITEVTVNFGVVPTNPVRVLIMKAN